MVVDTHSLNKIASKDEPFDEQLSSEDLKDVYKYQLMYTGDISTLDKSLVEIQGGIVIKDLNDQLWDMGLALPNMGGYDGQTMAGVISTGTHGSGYTLGPLHTMVKSIVLITTGSYDGKIVGGPVKPYNESFLLYRIEPENGITNPQKYTNSKIGLIQNTDVFRASRVSLGCFGIIYSMVIEVIPSYYLAETRLITNWDDFQIHMQPQAENINHVPDILFKNRHVELYINPYKYNDNHSMIVCTRNMVDGPDNRPHFERGSRNFWMVLGGKMKSAVKLAGNIMNIKAELIPELLHETLESMVTEAPPYIDKSFDVFNLGTHKDAGFALEIGVPIYVDDKYSLSTIKNVIDTVHKVVEEHRGNYLMSTSPFGVRFVDGDSSHLSMTGDTKIMTVEFNMIVNSQEGITVVESLDEAIQKLNVGARVHWGLDFINSEDKPKQYSEIPEWITYYTQFNSEKTFSNSFTLKMGFDSV